MLKKIRSALPDLARTATGFAGAAMIAYGFERIYAPLGYIIGGVLLLSGVILDARTR